MRSKARATQWNDRTRLQKRPEAAARAATAAEYEKRVNKLNATRAVRVEDGAKELVGVDGARDLVRGTRQSLCVLLAKEQLRAAADRAPTPKPQPLLPTYAAPAADSGKLFDANNWDIDGRRSAILRGHDRSTAVAAVLKKLERLSRGCVTQSAFRVGKGSDKLRQRLARCLKFVRGNSFDCKKKERAAMLFCGWKLLVALALRNEPRGLNLGRLDRYATHIAKRSTKAARALPPEKRNLATSVAAECQLRIFGTTPLLTTWDEIRHEIIAVELRSSALCALKESQPRAQRAKNGTTSASDNLAAKTKAAKRLQKKAGPA
eukprot:g13343.t1